MSSEKQEVVKELMDKDTKGLPPAEKQDLELVANNVIQKGMLLKEAMGLSDDMVEAIYGFAYRLYSMGKYSEALQMFRLLIMLDPTKEKFVLGLSACFHMQKDYRSAVSSYLLCTVVNPTNPIPHYHASDCYNQLKKDTLAVEQLKICIEKAGEKEEYAQVKNRAETILETMGMSEGNGKETKQA